MRRKEESVKMKKKSKQVQMGSENDEDAEMEDVSQAEPKKASLKDIINGQSSEGYWASGALLSSLAGELSEAKLRKEVAKLTTQDIDRVVFTIMALWVLENAFEDQEDEWQMIAAKARAYLKARNVPKVAPLFKACKA